MKQNITSEQLKELNFEDVTKLIKLSNTKLISIPTNKVAWEENRTTKRYLTEYISFIQSINIGKMIEMLDSKFYSLYLNHKNEFDVMVEEKNSEWCNRFEGKELCDALWDAIKTILL